MTPTTSKKVLGISGGVTLGCLLLGGAVFVKRSVDERRQRDRDTQVASASAASEAERKCIGAKGPIEDAIAKEDVALAQIRLDAAREVCDSGLGGYKRQIKEIEDRRTQQAIDDRRTKEDAERGRRAAAKAEAGGGIAVQDAQLLEDFEDNEPRALKTYGGKFLLGGTVERVLVEGGQPVVKTRPTNRYRHVTIHFLNTDRPRVSSLSPGQWIEVICLGANASFAHLGVEAHRCKFYDGP